MQPTCLRPDDLELTNETDQFECGCGRPLTPSAEDKWKPSVNEILVLCESRKHCEGRLQGVPGKRSGRMDGEALTDICSELQVEIKFKSSIYSWNTLVYPFAYRYLPCVKGS